MKQSHLALAIWLVSVTTIPAYAEDETCTGFLVPPSAVLFKKPSPEKILSPSRAEWLVALPRYSKFNDFGKVRLYNERAIDTPTASCLEEDFHVEGDFVEIFTNPTQFSEDVAWVRGRDVRTFTYPKPRANTALQDVGKNLSSIRAASRAALATPPSAAPEAEAPKRPARQYRRPLDTVWGETLAVLLESGWTIVEANKPAGLIRTKAMEFAPPKVVKCERFGASDKEDFALSAVITAEAEFVNVRLVLQPSASLVQEKGCRSNGSVENIVLDAISKALSAP